MIWWAASEALHELATNAGKCGALSTDKGRVEVCWGIESHALTMNWIERGGRVAAGAARLRQHSYRNDGDP
jgi:two-component sensor histidine kinase